MSRKRLTRRPLIAALGSLAAACGSPAPNPPEPVASVESAIVRGAEESGRNAVMELRIEYSSVSLPGNVPNVGFCSSVLFAPRVLLTAAHCINPVRRTASGGTFIDHPFRILAYIGNAFTADLAALGAPANVPAPPAPSRFMLADSWESHPGYSTTQLFPDLAVVYLDRQPRLPPAATIVDGLPLGRTRLGAANLGQAMTIIGYGASVAHDALATQIEGQRIKRSGTSAFAGAPVTSPLPPDPHPGLGIAAVVNGLMQLDGRAPRANSCIGDSGGPALRNVGGQDFVFGVASWTGDFCEAFSYYTRLDPFLPFLDASYMKGGQATVIPRLECVTPTASGGLHAYFGYQNRNGIVVEVPFGTRNALAADTAGARPSRFLPGDHGFVFGVDLGATPSITYRLSPTNSPTTTLTVSARSPRCDLNDRSVICARSCDASQRAACGETMSDCVGECLAQYEGITPCEGALDAYNRCLATEPAEAFTCFDVSPFDISGTCDPQFNAFFSCLGGG